MKKKLFDEIKYFNKKILLGTFSDLDIYFDKINKSEKVFFIVDENVFKLYKQEIIAKTKRKIIWIKIVTGEKNKILNHAYSIIEHLTNNKFQKDDILVGFGGGVTLDITGFIASVLYRGVNYIAIPTTLLSMVDASIGGKNGLDFYNIKNYLGTTYIPEFTLIDKTYLKTLPKSEKFSGTIEIIKIGLLKSFWLYKSIVKNYSDEISKRNILKSISLKVSICKKDLENNDKRQLLNYGHTIGHIIESSLNFEINHGLAVLYGMILENQFLYEKQLIKKKVFEKIRKTLTNLEYYNSYDMINIIKSIDTDFLLQDKKVNENKVQLAVILRRGKSRLEKVSLSELIEFIKRQK